MTTTATPFMRPLRLPELLDQAIRLYRNNFITFIGIIAIPYIPLTLIQAGMSVLSTGSLLGQSSSASPEEIFTNPGYWLGISGALMTGFLQFILVQGVATAALTRAVSDNYIGQRVGILASYRKIGWGWVRLLLALLLMACISFVLLIWIIVPCVGWLTGPGLLFFVALVVTPLIAPVIVLERRGIGGSLRRAWDLARSRFWWLIGFAFVVSLFGQLVITGPTLLVTSIIQSAIPLTQLPMDQFLVMSTIIQTIVTMIGSLLYLPLQSTAMTVVYFDLRVRSEGLDLALQTAAPSGEETSTDAPLPEIASSTPTAFITGSEVGYFVVLTIVGGILYALFASLFFGMLMLLVPTAGALP